jgi:hypothetical protein
MNTYTEHHDFAFEPPLTIPGRCELQVEIHLPDGKARVRVLDSVSKFVIEDRPDCQVVEETIVAMPGSIEKRKLPWKVRLLRWLARG